MAEVAGDPQQSVEVPRMLDKSVRAVAPRPARQIRSGMVLTQCRYRHWVDLEMKAKAMAMCEAGEPVTERPWKEDKGVIAFLNAI